MSRIVEKYYSIQELGFLLGFGEKWVRARVHSGDFGANCVDTGTDIRIPASGVQIYLDAHPLVTPLDLGIPARSPGELRRKISNFSAS